MGRRPGAVSSVTRNFPFYLVLTVRHSVIRFCGDIYEGGESRCEAAAHSRRTAAGTTLVEVIFCGLGAFFFFLVHAQQPVRTFQDPQWKEPKTPGRREVPSFHGPLSPPPSSSSSPMATLRRFSSEGSLLDLDFFSWRKVDLKRTEHDDQRDYGTSSVAEVEEDTEQLPAMQEPSACKVIKKELTKELSVSVENLRDLQEKKSKSHHLEVAAIGEGCRAYSDSQLAPAAKESIGGVEREDLASPSTSSAAHPFVLKSQHRAKLSAAKLHLKSLFGQSPHSSNSNLSNTEHKDSAKERRSRLLFMRQWSQVGHSKRHGISREELERWAQSLDNLLASQTGVLVFGAFLRSEFSEENLQFYLACQQYKHSSNNFSLQRRAKDICATYILAGSPREVNIDSKTRDLTVRLLQAPSHTSLSHAQRRIYSLLDTDCYPRFLESTIYLGLLREAD